MVLQLRTRIKHLLIICLNFVDMLPVETIQFTSLNHTNYADWAVRMQAILVRDGYWDIVSGNEKLASGADDEVAKAFRKKQAQCKAAIVLRVDDSQIPHITDEDPKAVWEALAAVHRARGFGSRLQLRRSFMTATMKEGQSMESWIRDVRALSNKLKAIDVNVDDEEIIVVLTVGLTRSYTPVIISLDSVDADKLSLSYVITRLLNEESRQALDKEREEFTKHRSSPPSRPVSPTEIVGVPSQRRGR